jgi:hypothetical protein
VLDKTRGHPEKREGGAPSRLALARTLWIVSYYFEFQTVKITLNDTYLYFIFFNLINSALKMLVNYLGYSCIRQTVKA